jgi:glutathione S-transferase
MLILRNFTPAFGLPSPSPFGIKAIALLKMSGLAFENHPSDVRKAPLGKLPVLQDGDLLIPDSSRIQSYLEDTYDINFTEGLSAEKLAIGRAFQSMIEEHLYFIEVYGRWVDNNHLLQPLFASLPRFLQPIVQRMVTKNITKSLHQQGIGRHDRDYIYQVGSSHLQALSDYLAEKRFFFGDRAHAIDAILYAFIECIITPDIPTPLKDAAMQHQNLLRHAQRFKSEVME